MDPHAVEAARNNADWCDLVCRTHGIGTRFGPDVWVSLRRSPPAYPDAVTLRDGLDAGDVLRGTDMSGGCSVKDSFAAVDLKPAGFRLLFEAEWIYREPGRRPAEDGLTWTVVQAPEELRIWAAAHGGGDVFRPALLDDPAVAILAARDGGTVVGGVIGNRSKAVVGVSNLFATTDPDRVRAGAPNAVSGRFPGLPLVGYEGGDSLAAARRAGFAGVGPLRVWIKD